MKHNSGRCCCLFTCLSASAGIAILFLGLFLVILCLLQSSEHHALKSSGWALLGSGSGLLILSGLSLLCPSGRNEIYDCCLHHNHSSQVGAENNNSDIESINSDYTYSPPKFRIIPPTPHDLNLITNLRPITAPEFINTS